MRHFPSQNFNNLDYPEVVLGLLKVTQGIVNAGYGTFTQTKGSTQYATVLLRDVLARYRISMPHTGQLANAANALGTQTAFGDATDRFGSYESISRIKNHTAKMTKSKASALGDEACTQFGHAGLFKNENYTGGYKSHAHARLAALFADPLSALAASRLLPFCRGSFFALPKQSALVAQGIFLNHLDLYSMGFALDTVNRNQYNSSRKGNNVSSHNIVSAYNALILNNSARFQNLSEAVFNGGIFTPDVLDKYSKGTNAFFTKAFSRDVNMGAGDRTNAGIELLQSTISEAASTIFDFSADVMCNMNPNLKKGLFMAPANALSSTTGLSDALSSTILSGAIRRIIDSTNRPYAPTDNLEADAYRLLDEQLGNVFKDVMKRVACGTADDETIALCEKVLLDIENCRTDDSAFQMKAFAYFDTILNGLLACNLMDKACKANGKFIGCGLARKETKLTVKQTREAYIAAFSKRLSGDEEMNLFGADSLTKEETAAVRGMMDHCGKDAGLYARRLRSSIGKATTVIGAFEAAETLANVAEGIVGNVASDPTAFFFAQSLYDAKDLAYQRLAAVNAEKAIDVLQKAKSYEALLALSTAMTEAHPLTVRTMLERGSKFIQDYGLACQDATAATDPKITQCVGTIRAIIGEDLRSALIACARDDNGYGLSVFGKAADPQASLFDDCIKSLLQTGPESEKDRRDLFAMLKSLGLNAPNSDSVTFIVNNMEVTVSEKETDVTGSTADELLKNIKAHGIVEVKMPEKFNEDFDNYDPITPGGVDLKDRVTAIEKLLVGENMSKLILQHINGLYEKQ